MGCSYCRSDRPEQSITIHASNPLAVHSMCSYDEVRLYDLQYYERLLADRHRRSAAIGRGSLGPVQRVRHLGMLESSTKTRHPHKPFAGDDRQSSVCHTATKEHS